MNLRKAERMALQPSGKLNSQQAWMAYPETISVMAALCDTGDEARFVGGCVRDTLVNKTVFDIDIATIWPPEVVIKRLKEAKIKAIPTGIEHGTITAVIDEKSFEITTLRQDIETDGRHAEVSFTTCWEQDAMRRDFTMNAIFCDMEKNLYDPCDGIADLRQGIVKFVGNANDRIEEDILRILRYFRFLAHYGKHDADTETLLACKASAEKLEGLSIERVTKETLKLLHANNSASIWELMCHYGIMPHLIPEATNTDALAQLIELELAEDQNHAYNIRRLAALICNEDQAVIKSIAKKLRLSNVQLRDLCQMTDQDILPDLNITEQDLRRLVYKFDNNTVRNLLLITAVRTKNVSDFTALYKYTTAYRPKRFLVTGDDAMAHNLKGAEIGNALRKVETWWIAQDFTPGRTECLEQLGKII